MNIVRFEPGDMTSYEVLFVRLTSDECHEAGVSAGSVLFGFNPRGRTPFSYYHFAGAGAMHWAYYDEKMGLKQHDTWTRNAGLRVFEHLTGREVIGEVATPTEMGWRGDWPEQLEGLDRVLAVAR